MHTKLTENVCTIIDLFSHLIQLYLINPITIQIMEVIICIYSREFVSNFTRKWGAADYESVRWNLGGVGVAEFSSRS